MSLINKMLQDLAQRQAPPSSNAPSQINPLSPPRKRKTVPTWVWIALMLLINIATVTWFSWHANRQSVSSTQRTVQQPKPAQPNKPVTPAGSLAQNRPAPPLPATPPATPLVAPSTAVSLPMPEPKPIATPLSNTAPSALPTSPRPTDHPAPSTDMQPPPVNSQAAPSIPPAGTIAIKKQAKQLTPAQLAQNEYLKALSLAQQGDREAAITGFDQALSLDPQLHQARLMMVGLLIESKRVAEAERRLQESLTDNPKQIDFAMLLARLQVEHEGVSTSIATLMRSLPFAANQADYQAFLAALLQRAGQNDQAIEHYTIALKQNPQSGLWWMGLGISEKAAMHPNAAHTAFARAKATNSLSPDLQAFVDQQLQQP